MTAFGHAYECWAGRPEGAAACRPACSCACHRVAPTADPASDPCDAYSATPDQWCATCGWHRIDHAMDAGGIGHPPQEAP